MLLHYISDKNRLFQKIPALQLPILFIITALCIVEQFIPVDTDKDLNTVNVNYARIIELLKEIKAKHYKDVRFEIDRSGAGITLFKSPTPVLKNDPRYALITADI